MKSLWSTLRVIVMMSLLRYLLFKLGGATLECLLANLLELLMQSLTSFANNGTYLCSIVLRRNCVYTNVSVFEEYFVCDTVSFKMSVCGEPFAI